MNVGMGDGLSSDETRVDAEVEAADTGPREHRDAFLTGSRRNRRPLAGAQFLDPLDVAHGNDEDVTGGQRTGVLKGHGGGHGLPSLPREGFDLRAERTPTRHIAHPAMITHRRGAETPKLA